MSERSTAGLAMGIFFMLAGGAFLLDAVGVWNLSAGVLWPMLLIGFGAALLVGNRLGRTPE